MSAPDSNSLAKVVFHWFQFLSGLTQMSLRSIERFYLT